MRSASRDRGGAVVVELGDFYAAELAATARLALLLTSDRGVAEELTMEAFARVAARWPRVATMDQPGAYVRRIVVNLATSRWRRQQVERRALARTRAAAAEIRWDVDVAERSRSVIEAIGQLPARQRAAVVLRYFEDMREADVARTLGCSIGTVKSQLSKARTRLAQLLGDNDDRDGGWS